MRAFFGGETETSSESPLVEDPLTEDPLTDDPFSSIDFSGRRGLAAIFT
jgi:hypothetical protein